MFITIIIFIITLLLLVVIHELGHFLAAKRFNIKVLEFGFGIPPRIFGKKIGETLVSLNWLPFGGFVRLLGEDDVDKQTLENKRSFASQVVGKRIIVVAMGVLMNLVLSWILFYLVLSWQGFKVQLPLLFEHQFVGVEQNNETYIVVAGVSNNSPADKAGLKKGERILAVNNEFLKDIGDLKNKLQQSAGSEVSLILSDLDKKTFRTVNVTPRQNPPPNEGSIGVALNQFQVANLAYSSFSSRFLAGPVHSWNVVAYSGRVFGKLLGETVRTADLAPVSHTVAGPVGITQAVDEILRQTKQPLLSYLNLVALLSLNLAVLNVLPFPALDGGRLFFLLIEATTRKRVHANVERWVHQIGFALLLTLMLLITFSDIKKIFP